MTASQLDFPRALAVVEAANPDLAAVLRHPDTEYVRLATPFLPAGWAVASLMRRLPTRALLMHVIMGPDGQGGLVTANPDLFIELVRLSGARVTEPTLALSLARTYVEATRVQNRRYQWIDSVMDLPWRPELSDAERAMKTQTLQRLGGDVSARASASGSGIAVEAIIVDDSDLIRAAFTVASDGSITVASRVIASDLPFMWVV